MLINVVGLGYIGLPTSLIFASNGFDVVGTDLNKQLIDKLNGGEVTFEEKGLFELYQKAVSKKIVFTTQYAQADFYIVAVPTPYDEVNKKIDPSLVIKAVDSILPFCKKGSTIIIESTVSPGTICDCVTPLIEKAGMVLGEDIFIAHAPERIIPGNMIFELSHNSRTIGCDNEEKGKEIVKMYQAITSGSVVLTSIVAAEMTKVVENTYRAINIAFANELLMICKEKHLDVYEIIKICNLHPRVNILQPGPGVGGHCISVDPWFLVGDFPMKANLIRKSMEINEYMPEFTLKRAFEIAKENNITDFGRIGIYGLTYKENVDDTRASPALQLIKSCAEHLGQCPLCFDPFVNKQIVDNQVFDFDSFVSKVDLIIVMVKHNHILDNKKSINGKVVLDTQNVLFGENVYKL